MFEYQSNPELDLLEFEELGERLRLSRCLVRFLGRSEATDALRLRDLRLAFFFALPLSSDEADRERDLRVDLTALLSSITSSVSFVSIGFFGSIGSSIGFIGSSTYSFTAA